MPFSGPDVDSSRLGIKYSGAAVDAGMMDAGQFVAALDGLRETLYLCGIVANGEEVETSLSIAAEIRVASFGFDVVLSQIVQTAGSLLTNDVVKSSLEVIKIVFGENGLISLFKVTKGEPPSRLTRTLLDNGSVQVNAPVNAPITTRVNNYFIAPKELWQGYERADVRNALWATMQPLDSKGIEAVDFMMEDGEKTRVTASEARLFFPQRDTDYTKDDLYEYEDILTIVKQSFANRRRWNFESMQGSFGAIITDAEFLARQARREIPIFKGDRLRAKIMVRTFKADKRRKKPKEPEYFITKVLDVVPPRDDNRQIRFDY